MIAVKFVPKSKAELRKVFNNIYVKNFPAEWNEMDLQKTFEEFGHISSVFLQQSQAGPFAFICFGSED